MFDDYWRGKGIAPAAISFTDQPGPMDLLSLAKPFPTGPAGPPGMPMRPGDADAGGAIVAQRAQQEEEEMARRRREMMAQLLGSRIAPNSATYFTPQQGAQLGTAVGNALRGGVFGGAMGPTPNYLQQIAGGGMAKGGE